MSGATPFSCGAAKVDITPPPGTHLTGDGSGKHRPLRDVLEPLYARAMVFDSGPQRVCVIAVDLTGVMEPHSRRVREQVADALQIPPEAVLFCATQTHSAPSMGGFMLDPEFPLDATAETQYVRGSEDRFIDFVTPRAVEAAVQALQALRPAELACGRGLLGDFAFNRRGVCRDGRSIQMPKPFGARRQPLGPPELCYMEGPVDPEVGILSVRTAGSVTALLLHHTCHPVINFGKPERRDSASPDWPGAWCEEVEQRFGPQTVPLVLNGCCGNVNPWHPFDPDFEPDHRAMGAALADMTSRVHAGLKYTPDAPVRFAVRRVSLPFRSVPAERAAEVERALSRNPQPLFRDDGTGVDPVWFRAASTRSVEIQARRDGAFEYEIQVFRVGDAAIVGLPGEPFVEGQLAIKVNSPAAYVQVAHMASHYVGYLPTRDAWNRVGHETNADVTYWSKLAPGALETVVVDVRDMVDEVFAETRGATSDDADTLPLTPSKRGHQ